MARSMALIENGAVINMLWCSDREPETDTLIDPADRPVGIGDTYTDGKFYRDGAEVLTAMEESQKQISELIQQTEELDNAYIEGVNSV